jgi:hypothetical protein
MNYDRVFHRLGIGCRVCLGLRPYLVLDATEQERRRDRSPNWKTGGHCSWSTHFVPDRVPAAPLEWCGV